MTQHGCDMRFRGVRGEGESASLLLQLLTHGDGGATRVGRVGFILN